MLCHGGVTEVLVMAGSWDADKAMGRLTASIPGIHRGFNYRSLFSFLHIMN